MPVAEQKLGGIIQLERTTIEEFKGAFQKADATRQLAVLSYCAHPSPGNRDRCLAATVAQQSVLNEGLVTRVRVLGLRLPFPFA